MCVRTELSEDQVLSLHDALTSLYAERAPHRTPDADRAPLPHADREAEADGASGEAEEEEEEGMDMRESMVDGYNLL